MGGREEKELLIPPPVQAHRPRSEKFKLGGLRLRGESWEEALYRYFLRGSGARCPKVGRREVCFPPRAMGSSAPQFRFPRYWGGARTHFFLFFFVLYPARKQLGYETRRRSGVERVRRAKPDAGGLIPRPCVMCSGVALPPSSPPLFQLSKKNRSRRKAPCFLASSTRKDSSSRFFLPLKLSRPLLCSSSGTFYPPTYYYISTFLLGGEGKNPPFLS